MAAVGSTEPQKRDVEWFRQCPHCWDKQGGVGTAVNTLAPDELDQQIGRRYYKCDRCGLGFSRDFEVAFELVTKRVVRVIKR